MRNDKLLIFKHIPKTGGSTLQGIINYQYNFNKNCLYSINQETLFSFLTLSQEKKDKIKAIEFYVNLEPHQYLIKEPIYITMLRDPIDRVISHYYYRLSGISAYNKEKREKIISNNYSLKDFVQNGVFPNAENLQVRMLSGNLGISHGSCTREMLNTAIRNIDEQYTLVGITEYFDEFLIMLMVELGWKRYPFYCKVNVTHNKPQKAAIDKETLKIIEKYNHLDIELYQYAKEKFETRLKQMDGNFYKKLENFKKWNRTLAPLISVALNIKQFLTK